jgi:acetolactate synthase-1/2/3 large subunit
MDEHKVSLTGGEALARMLKLSRIEFMFGMGGFQLLPFYDAICRDDDTQFQHILVSDERSGAFAADACARVSGKPGLCDGTMGPGATNLTNGLIESYHAGIPIVAVVGDSNRLHSWKNMTQETRQREVLSPIVKEYLSVEVGTRIPELVRRAFVTATSGRPGPVVLCVPETVSYGEWEFDEADFFIPNHSLKTPSFRIAPDPEEVARAAGLIKKAERPLLLVGGGIHLSGAYTELERFATDLNIPVAYTLSGKGCLPGNHPLCVHLFGRWNRIANELIQESDLLIGLGFKFGEISTNRYTIFPKHTQIVHIDITPEEIGRHQSVAVGLWADCRLALTALREESGPGISAQKKLRNGYVTSIKEMLVQWRDANQARLTSNETPINMSRVCHE